ncbi:MAG: PCRF domain-containing protein [Chloroflexi bacterium]|nr:MAG: PCRF domain-containing protein [Chloroflexota bacterium]
MIATWDRLERRARDLVELDQLSRGDPELEKQLAEERASLAKEVRAHELDLLFTDPYANHNAVVTISVGQGGVEAQDWVEMLMRMYLKWAERRGFETEIVDESRGEEAGLKSATFIVRGPRAYGLLRSEHGVHRLVRISPFDQIDHDRALVGALQLGHHLDQIRGQVMPAEFGSQIRNYVLQPYTLVKDVRTGLEVGNTQAVLDGEIDPFIESWLRWRLGKTGEVAQAS